nr:MAG TPA: PcfK-like protein [Caudoviricetes sp.]
MNKLNLKANSDYERAILDYLESNASDALAAKINSGQKTLQSCFDYIRGEAKKQAKSGCAMISDAVVFGWAIHYFEEDSIKAITYTKKDEIEKAPVIEKKVAKKTNDNFSIFDLMGE